MLPRRTSHATPRTVLPAPPQHGLPPSPPAAATASAEASALVLWASSALYQQDEAAARAASAVRHVPAGAGHRPAPPSVPARVPLPVVGGGRVARCAADDAGGSVFSDSRVERSAFAAAVAASAAAAAAGAAAAAAAAAARCATSGAPTAPGPSAPTRARATGPSSHISPSVGLGVRPFTRLAHSVELSRPGVLPTTRLSPAVDLPSRALPSL